MVIDDLKQLELKALVGPWNAVFEYHDEGINDASGSWVANVGPFCSVVTSWDADDKWHKEVQDATAKLTAAMHNLVPELLALWEALNEWERLRKIAGKPTEARSYEGGLMTLNSHIHEAEWMVRPLLDALNVKAASLDA